MKAKPWKTLHSTNAFDHQRMQLVEDEVELPDGTVTSYLKHAPTKTHSVAVIAVNDKQEVLLQKEYSYPPDEVLWQLPGGGILVDENAVTAANRELSEESDVVGSTCEEIGYYYVNNRRSDQKQYVVLCTGIKPKAGQRDAEEFIETHWIPVADLRSMIASGQFTNVTLLAALNLFLAWSNL